ncbi:hypothetical protein OKW39_001799 [Paraburkholderia sp. MM6662-R1]
MYAGVIGVLAHGADFRLVAHALERGKGFVERGRSGRRRILRIHRHQQHALGARELQLVQHCRNAGRAVAHCVVDQHRVVVQLQQMAQALDLLFGVDAQR